jgi:hypothetical protein
VDPCGSETSETGLTGLVGKVCVVAIRNRSGWQKATKKSDANKSTLAKQVRTLELSLVFTIYEH